MKNYCQTSNDQDLEEPRSHLMDIKVCLCCIDANFGMFECLLLGRKQVFYECAPFWNWQRASGTSTLHQTRKSAWCWKWVWCAISTILWYWEVLEVVLQCMMWDWRVPSRHHKHTRFAFKPLSTPGAEQRARKLVLLQASTSQSL